MAMFANLKSGQENVLPAKKPPLVGSVVKTLYLYPYNVVNIADALRRGGYDDVSNDVFNMGVELGLSEGVKVELVQFDHDPLYEDIILWAEINGNKEPMQAKHLLGIGMQYPCEQHYAPIVEVSSVQRYGRGLCLTSGHVWGHHYTRYCRAVRGWNQPCLFGFISKE